MQIIIIFGFEMQSAATEKLLSKSYFIKILKIHEMLNIGILKTVLPKSKVIFSKIHKEIT